MSVFNEAKIIIKTWFDILLWKKKTTLFYRVIFILAIPLAPVIIITLSVLFAMESSNE